MNTVRDDAGAPPAILGGPPIRSGGPPTWPVLDDATSEVLHRAAGDGSWGLYQGEHSRELSERLSTLHECEHVVLCASGTVAVELALRGLKIGPGDEVLLAAYDFRGNLQDVLCVGATPVLVDIRSDNWNLDVEQLEAAITEKTRALIVSHLHGGLVDMATVRRIADSHGLAVIEDACQMPGATVCDRIAGTWGDVAILSFGGSKLLSAGRGGALLTNDESIVQRARLYSHRGNEAYPLSELQAALLVPQLKRLEERNQQRAGAVERLINECFSGPGLQAFANPHVGDSQPGYYKLGLQYDPHSFDGLSREGFAKAVRAEGIAIDAGFRSLHRSHSQRRFQAPGPLPHADEADEKVLVLHHPILLGATADLDQISVAIQRVQQHALSIRETLGFHC